MRRYPKPRFGLQLLEDRTLLTSNVYEAISSAITHPGTGQFGQVLNQIAAAASDHLVPLVGTPLTNAADLLSSARSNLHTALTGLAADAGATQVQEAIAARLGSAPGGLNILGDRNTDGIIDFKDVTVDIDISDPDFPEVDISFDLKKEIELSETAPGDFDIGLPSLPLYIRGQKGSVQASFGYEYDNFHFGYKNKQAFFDYGAPGEPNLTFFAGAGLSPDFKLDGALGFIYGSIAVDGPTGLNAHIDIDLIEGAAPAIKVGGNAEVNLGLSAELIGPNFPGISTVLHVGWDDGFAAAPVIEFRDVTVEFSSRFLAPIIEHLEPILAPAGWVVEKLNAPVPVLSDLSEALNLGSISVMSVIETIEAWDVLSPEYDAIAKGIITVSDIVGILDGLSSEDGSKSFQLNFGNFKIDGGSIAGKAAGDITVVSNEPLSQLKIDPSSFDPSAFDLDWVREKVSKLPDPFPQSLKDSLDEMFDELENGVKISYPLLDNPGKSIFPMLLGQDADLFRLEAHFNPTKNYDGTFGTPIGIDAKLEGTFEPELDLEFGIDTFGVRTFVSDIFQGKLPQPASLLDGFYFDEDSAFRLNVGISAGVGLNAVVFHAEVKGGVQGTFSIEIPEEVRAAVNGKVRLRSDLDECLFHISGGVSASLIARAAFGVEFPFGNFVGVEKQWVLASKNLISFNIDCVPNPWAEVANPTLATMLAGGELRLNIGPNSGARNHEPGITDETYFIVASAPQEGDAPGLAVDVYFEGQRQRFDGVASIVGDAGTGNDNIAIDLGTLGANVTIVLQGGAGNDALQVEGGKLIGLNGDGNDDTLVAITAGEILLGGGDGNDSLSGSQGTKALLFGGQGHDTLTYQGTGTTQLLGQAGNDLLYGGAGDNYLEGEDGNDMLVGGSGTNELWGGTGNDTLTAGPNGDLLEGGNGSDTYITGAGDDTINVTDGQFVNSVETISWDYGDGNTQINAPIGLKVILEVLGSPNADFFRMRDGVMPGTVQIEAPLGKIITGSGLDDVSIDGRAGADHIIIEALQPSQDVDRIGVNLTDNLANDGAVDLIEVFGSTGADQLVIDQDQVILEAYEFGQQYKPETLNWGGVMTISGMPEYTVFVMNNADNLRVQTVGGADHVEILSVTGPTLVDTGTGNDVIDLSATTAGEPGVITFEGPIPPDFAAVVVVEAGPGINRLTVDEVQNKNPDTFTVTDKQITSILLPGVVYRATGGTYEQVAIIGTPLYDVFQVHSTATIVGETVVHGWDGNDTFQVGLTAGLLRNVNGALTVTAGTSGNSAVILSDRMALSGNGNVHFEGDKVIGLAGPSDNVSIRFDSWGADLLVALEGSNSALVSENFTIDNFARPLHLEGRAGSESFNVLRLAAPAALYGEAGNEIYTVGPNLGLLAATLTIGDPLGNNVINVSDASAVGGRIYELNGNALNVLGNGHDELVLSGTVGKLNVATSAFSDQFRAFGVPGSLSVDVDLKAGTNVLVGPNVPTTWKITGINTVTVGAKANFLQASNLQGGAADDLFDFGNVGQITGKAIGGAGADTLNYSTATGPIVVDLALGMATRVGSVAQIENVIGSNGNDFLFGDAGPNRLDGSSGNDVIVGRAGNDVLIGGRGRDLLIGGLGSDQLNGGGGDDILIGGTTTHDDDQAALTEVIRLWSREDLRYQRRVALLRADALTGLTVFDDGVPDRLAGEDGLDWFWAFAGDRYDQAKPETVG